MLQFSNFFEMATDFNLFQMLTFLPLIMKLNPAFLSELIELYLHFLHLCDEYFLILDAFFQNFIFLLLPLQLVLQGQRVLVIGLRLDQEVLPREHLSIYLTNITIKKLDHNHQIFN